jgi:hypothetical protein
LPWHSTVPAADEEFLRDMATHRALAGEVLAPVLVLPWRECGQTSLDRCRFEAVALYFGHVYGLALVSGIRQGRREGDQSFGRWVTAARIRALPVSSSAASRTSTSLRPRQRLTTTCPAS